MVYTNIFVVLCNNLDSLHLRRISHSCIWWWVCGCCPPPQTLEPDCMALAGGDIPGSRMEINMASALRKMGTVGRGSCEQLQL